MTQEDHKSDRINFEVVLYKGCTLHEMLIIGTMAFGLSFVLFTVLFWVLFNLPLIGFALGIPVGVVVMLGSAVFIGNLKLNKPQGYYLQIILMWLEDKNFYKTPFVRRSGKWSTRRFLS